MFSCVLGERAGLLRSWFMYFPSSPKWESCWGQCKVLSLTTSPGSFPAPVSLPRHRFCSWHNTGRGGGIHAGSGILKVAWRGTCRGRPSHGGTTHCPFVPFCREHSLLVCPADSGFQARATHCTLASPSPGRTPWPIPDSPGPLTFHDLTYPYPSTSQLEHLEKGVKTSHLDLLDYQECTTNYMSVSLGTETFLN